MTEPIVLQPALVIPADTAEKVQHLVDLTEDVRDTFAAIAEAAFDIFSVVERAAITGYHCDDYYQAFEAVVPGWKELDGLMSEIIGLAHAASCQDNIDYPCPPWLSEFLTEPGLRTPASPGGQD